MMAMYLLILYLLGCLYTFEDGYAPVRITISGWDDNILVDRHITPAI